VEYTQNDIENDHEVNEILLFIKKIKLTDVEKAALGALE
jgi:hypothetical protein